MIYKNATALLMTVAAAAATSGSADAIEAIAAGVS